MRQPVSVISQTTWSVAGSSTIPSGSSAETIVLNASGGTITVTLPPVASNQGKIFKFIRDTDNTGTSYCALIAGNGSEKIGYTYNKYALYKTGASVTLKASGSGWQILDYSDQVIGVYSVSHNNWMSWNSTTYLGPGSNPPPQYNFIRLYEGEYTVVGTGRTTISQNSTITSITHYYELYLDASVTTSIWARCAGTPGSAYDSYYLADGQINFSVSTGNSPNLNFKHITSITGGSGSLATGSIIFTLYKVIR